MTKPSRRRTRRHALLVAALGVGGALLVGPNLFSAGAQSEPPARTSDVPPTLAPPLPDLLPDGRHFGAVGAAYVGPPELTFDQMELLVGPEAREAARADGRSEDEVGDFSIRDDDATVRSLPVAGDVVVTRVDCSGGGCVEGVPSDYDTFTRDVEIGAGRYWVTVEHGAVVRIDEQFLP